VRFIGVTQCLCQFWLNTKGKFSVNSGEFAVVYWKTDLFVIDGTSDNDAIHKQRQRLWVIDFRTFLSI